MTKLTPEQKAEISLNTHTLSITALASHYEVSRRTIQFILAPEKEAKNKLDKPPWQKYYKKRKQKIYMRTYRNKLKKDKPLC